MEKKLVKLAIISINAEMTLKFRDSIIKQNQYFRRVEIEIFNDIKEVESANILVIFSDQNLKLESKKASIILKGKISKVFAVNIDSGLTWDCGKEEYKTFFNESTKKIDLNAIAFSILYNYYDFLVGEEKKIKKVLNKLKRKETIEAYNKYKHKEILSYNIDQIIMENQKHGFCGYEELKTMIMFCIINKEKIKYDKDYTYIQDAMCEICDHTIYNIKNNIEVAIYIIVSKKKILKIQPILIRMRGRGYIEKAIIMGKVVEYYMKNKWGGLKYDR